MNLVSFLLWILMGGIAGWLASVIVGTRARQGTLADILIGIFGAFVGGFLFNLIGAAGVTGFNLYSLFVAFIGAVVLLALGRAVRSAI
jgi:uncharacterized membrane protein YeaQ/YmgE (transglycosylase-associated protein family)